LKIDAKNNLFPPKGNLLNQQHNSHKFKSSHGPYNNKDVKLSFISNKRSSSISDDMSWSKKKPLQP